MDPRIPIALVGVGGRGRSMQTNLASSGRFRVQAVCDPDPDGLEHARQLFDAPQAFDDYQALLAGAEVDAVLLATPMHLHASQAIAALERGLHVLSEVPAAVSLPECEALVAAASASSAVYMMAENYCHQRSVAIVTEMVRRGAFGETHYAEGAYLHELRELGARTPWRRRWQTGVDGITYGTHQIGPILNWMPGERIVSVCCAGSGHHQRDERGERYQNQDSCLMLGSTGSGKLIQVRVDMLSDRPHACGNFSLQGIDGAFESARAENEHDRIWLRSHDDQPRWRPLEELAEEFLPERWRRHGDAAANSGHGGGDLLVLLDFADAIAAPGDADAELHRALDITLPELISQESIAAGGAWLPVPDSRAWQTSCAQTG